MKKENKICSARHTHQFIGKMRGVLLVAVCALSFLSCEGQISAIDVTRKGTFNVYRNDTLVSTHYTQEEAQAKATEMKAIWWQAKVYWTTPDRYEVEITGVPPRVDTVLVEVPVEVIKEVPVEVVVHDTITIIEEVEVPVEVVVRDTIVQEVEVVVRDTIYQEKEVVVERPVEVDTIRAYGHKVLTDYTDKLNRPAPAIYYVQLQDIGVVEVLADSIPRWQKIYSLERTKSYGQTTYRHLGVPLQFINFEIWDITATSARVSYQVSQDDFETVILSIKKADASMDWDTYIVQKDWDGIVTNGPLEPDTEYLVSLYVATLDGQELNSRSIKFKTQAQ